MKRFMDWLRSKGPGDRRAPFSPPVPEGGRRRDDRIKYLEWWVDQIEQHSLEAEASVQSMRESYEGER